MFLSEKLENHLIVTLRLLRKLVISGKVTINDYELPEHCDNVGFFGFFCYHSKHSLVHSVFRHGISSCVAYLTVSTFFSSLAIKNENSCR